MSRTVLIVLNIVLGSLEHQLDTIEEEADLTEFVWFDMEEMKNTNYPSNCHDSDDIQIIPRYTNSKVLDDFVFFDNHQQGYVIGGVLAEVTLILHCF